MTVPKNVSKIKGVGIWLCNAEHPKRPGVHCTLAWQEGQCIGYRGQPVHHFEETWQHG